MIVAPSFNFMISKSLYVRYFISPSMVTDLWVALVLRAKSQCMPVSEAQESPKENSD